MILAFLSEAKLICKGATSDAIVLFDKAHVPNGRLTFDLDRISYKYRTAAYGSV